MAVLHELPLDILFEIILPYLDRSSGRSLRATNRALYKLCTPLVFRSLSIRIHEDFCKSAIISLISTRIIDTIGPNIGNHVRHLRINPMDAKVLSFTHRVTGHGAKLDEVEKSLEMSDRDEVRKKARMRLQTFVESLTSLERISWCYRTEKVLPGLTVPLTKALSALPKLKHLTFEMYCTASELNQPIPISSFKELQSLEISFNGNEFYNCWFQEILPAVNASPGLKSLDLSARAEDTRSIKMYELLTSSQPLRLEHLGLDYVAIRRPDDEKDPVQSEEKLARAFASLKSLKLQGNDMDWKLVYAALRRAGVKLRALKTELLPKAGSGDPYGLLGYLGSYSGLEELVLWNCNGDKVSREPSAKIFWQKVVPMHYGTLKKLGVWQSTSGGWCYGPLASEAILKCEKLLELSLPICDISDDWAREKTSGNETWKNMVDNITLDKVPERTYELKPEDFAKASIYAQERMVLLPDKPGWGRAAACAILLLNDIVKQGTIEIVFITVAAPQSGDPVSLLRYELKVSKEIRGLLTRVLRTEKHPDLVPGW